MSRLARFGHWLWDQPAVLLSLTVLFWSGNIVVGRAAAEAVPPATLAQVRWTGAFLIILPFAWGALKRDLPVIRQNFAVLTVLAFTGITIYNTIAYWGLRHTEAINANLLQTTAPVMIAAWSFLLFRERLTRRQALGIVLATAGVVTVVARGDAGLLLALDLNVGDLAFGGALTIFSFYTAFLRRRPPMASLSFLAVTLGWGAAMLVPLTALELTVLGRALVPGPLAWFSLAYVVIFPSLLAYLCFNRGVAMVGPNRAGFSYFLFPVYGAVLSIAFLGETIRAFHLVGTALILGGVFVALRR